MIRVYLDDGENATDELSLHAVRLSAPWNGWAVPVVTAAEFRRFIGAWRANDPNGEWHPEGVTEGDGALVYRLPWRDEDERDVWSAVDIDADGNALYALDGWTWEEGS